MAALRAFHKTLLKLVEYNGWGFEPTSFGKAHLLHLRSKAGGRLVNNGAQWDHPEVLKAGIRASYSEKLALYYCTTYKGFIHIEEHLDKEKSERMLSQLFEKIFVEEDMDFVKYRF